MLDAALSDHFNGITVPGCRFAYSPRHGVPPDGTTMKKRRSDRLVISFSSLGNGLVRHEFGGSLASVNRERVARHGDEGGVNDRDANCHHRHDGSDGDDVDDGAFDVLFVADPSQSWYQKDDAGAFDGYAQYESRIRAASRPYSRISLVGDSMGGSAALLFSHLATDAIVAFSLKVDLECDASHVGRSDMTVGLRKEFPDLLYRNVGSALDAGVSVIVHRGSEETDVRHTDLLENRFTSRSSKVGVARIAGGDDVDGILRIVEHSDCPHHQIAVHLKGRGMLMQRVLMGYKTAFPTLDALTFFIWLCLVVTIRTNDFREE